MPLETNVKEMKVPRASHVVRSESARPLWRLLEQPHQVAWAPRALGQRVSVTAQKASASDRNAARAETVMLCPRRGESLPVPSAHTWFHCL